MYRKFLPATMLLPVALAAVLCFSSEAPQALPADQVVGFDFNFTTTEVAEQTDETAAEAVALAEQE